MSTYGWYDSKTGEVCCVVSGLGGVRTFAGTYQEFLERCERLDREASARVALSRVGYDANGSPVED